VQFITAPEPMVGQLHAYPGAETPVPLLQQAQQFSSVV
jgi:hypothetical protein